MLRRLAFAAMLITLAACAGTPFEWSDARRVTLGMTEPEVLNIMGKPYSSRSNGDGVTWVWSYANTFSGTRAVSVVFKDGKVVKAPPIPDSY